MATTLKAGTRKKAIPTKGLGTKKKTTPRKPGSGRPSAYKEVYADLVFELALSGFTNE